MNSIDFYTEKTKDKDGGQHRTKIYPFVDDGVILVQKSEKNFAELKKRIKHCKEQDVSIPLYFDYKCDGKNCWILEELASGQEFESLVRNENITKIFGNMPYEHIKKYIEDVYLLQKNGISVEPRRRNIFYDADKGFTTIDVSLSSKSIELDSLKEVNYFFDMFAPVFLVPFSDDEYGQVVKEKTILNTMKAFESAHPYFEKYKRWIYRGNSYFAQFLKNHGVNLTLDSEEHNELVNLINELIDNIVQDKIEQPETLFINNNVDYINLLNSSISYCPNFNLFNLEEKTLEQYIENAVYNKIKSMFVTNVNDDNLLTLYYRIRRKELDPVDIYPSEYVYEQITEEIKSINKKKK